MNDRQPPSADGLAGVDGLIAAASRLAAEAMAARKSNAWVIRRLGEDYAYIHLADLRHPIRFLRQMAGQPPIRLGTDGFRRDLVDDANPARHYIAFLVVGYWLPPWAAVATLWLWEIAGFIRYRGVWSWPDLASGYVGIRHGRLARRYGVAVLPALMASDLTERG